VEDVLLAAEQILDQITPVLDPALEQARDEAYRVLETLAEAVVGGVGDIVQGTVEAVQEWFG
jgi:hypothetical protein